MLVERVEIVNKLGIHARSASKLVALAKTFPCRVKIGLSEDDMQNAKSIMGVLKLAAQRGTKVVLITDGDEEDTAMHEVKQLIAAKFDEPE
ncbi:MAG: HPr family phosphocarrier protein [Gammaproteobacteria bacterium]|nr:HPr family phosphocarrier protein [Gammaproteobacteria bacterium]